MANKVAIIETKPSRVNYKQEFDHAFEFDQFQLCSNPQTKKVLKKDCDIVINVDDYDWIILVGSESVKYFTKVTSVSDHSGSIIDDKFLAIINPAMLAFKPEMRKTWEESKQNIVGYISGEKVKYEVDPDQIRGIQDTAECNAFLRAAIAGADGVVGIDSETTALYPRNGHMLGISISYKDDHGAYIDVDCFDEESEELLQQLCDKNIMVFHNSKFDIAFFEYHLNIKIHRHLFADTMLMHYILEENPGTHGLKQLAIKYTKYGDYEKPMYEWIKDYCAKNKVLKSQFQWASIPFDVMTPYACIDAIVTRLLYFKFLVFKKNPTLWNTYQNILIPATDFLLDVQDNGVPFDIDRLKFSQSIMQNEIDGAIKELYSFNEVRDFEEVQGKEFNPNSVLQLRGLLFDFLGLRPTGKKTGTGQNSTDAEVLKELANEHPVPAHILKIRQKSKIKNTYLDKIIPQLDRDGRLRTNFNLHGTTSGRLSSSGKLNMQQLPRDDPSVKGCIKAKPGYKIVAMDLTTAEVYVAAVLSGDTSLMEVFKSGGNFHSTIAQKVFKLPCEPDEVVEKFPLQRQMAKAITFGIMYGAGANKISQEISKSSGNYCSPQEAQELIDDYFREFHRLAAWIEETKAFIEANGFVYSHFGRKRRLPDVKSTDRGTKSHAVRSGLNFVVQSPASDINLIGAIEANAEVKAKKLDAKMFALVHDSVLAEVLEEHVEQYQQILVNCIQRDRGIMIPGCPVGVDLDVHDDYSLGKFNKLYGDNI